MGVSFTDSKKLLTLEKGRLPKNPLYAESGLGCADSTIKCFGLVIITFLARAGRPHKINASGFSKFDNPVGENFPALALMRISRVSPNCQHRI